MTKTSLPLQLKDVQEAASRINPYIKKTPLLEWRLMNIVNEALEFRLLIKAEDRQITSSFKVRGAFNQMLQLSQDDKRKGVVAFSSGNHAQAVAYAAHALEVPATIVMPADAPRIKRERTEEAGAHVILYDRTTESREALGQKLAEESGLKLIHPFDDVKTMAGQGTVGWEIFNQTQERHIPLDAIIVPCSGGGLAAGIAVTTGLYNKPPQIYTAEPECYADAARSLTSGKLAANSDYAAYTNCDALMAPSLGEKPFEILKAHGVKGLKASNEDIMAALALAGHFFDLKLEPSGAVALACAIHHRTLFKGAAVAVVASGGNIDPKQHAALMKVGGPIATHMTRLNCG